MSEPTLRSYLNGLRKLFVIESIKAWSPSIRSRTPLRTAEVWHLCDPSLAAAALDVNPDGLLNDLSTMGFLFETLCVRDLRIYARTMGGSINHYRDKNGLVADAIIRLDNGNWAGVEIKLGGEERINEGAQNLISLAQKVDAGKTGTPAFLMVVTGGQYAYTRPDGVHVVPIACLGA
jgi:predicted AAA+ superfamily ATPase